MSARPLLDALPRDFTLTLVDVGSAGGINPRWRPFSSILSSVLFDPREVGATGSFGRGRTRTYPVALGDHQGEAILYQTAMANMSSFLEPDTTILARHGKKVGDASVVATGMVPIERLDDLSAHDGFLPDVMKIDTQGSELMVLGGAETSLGSVSLAEIEVSFFQRYHGQPLLADIEKHMNDRGFELIDLLKLKRYRSANRLNIRNEGVRGRDRSGRLAYADAIFFRREDELRRLGKQGILGAVVSLAAYGKADMAARLVDVSAELLPSGQAEAIGRALRRLGPGIIGRLLGRAP